LCRWNSWNFFACNINETLIKETGTFNLSTTFLSMKKKKCISVVKFFSPFVIHVYFTDMYYNNIFTADALISTGLAKLGYDYVNIGIDLVCPK
jgi:hypothetical protein